MVPNAIMRSWIALALLVLGPLVGYLTAIGDPLSIRVAMSLLGLLFAAPLALAALGRSGRKSASVKSRTSTDGLSATSSDALVENFWRDRGHPPLMKPPDALPDKHQFDPDKLG